MKKGKKADGGFLPVNSENLKDYKKLTFNASLHNTCNIVFLQS